MFGFIFAVLLETRLATLDARLATAAQASPRPAECRGGTAGDDGLWLRLRGAEAQRYCDLLARGYARLNETPEEALADAAGAEALAGLVPAVRVLMGRAQLRLGQAALAYQQLASAEASTVQAFADPKALHDYARAASRAGQSAEALRLYRLLASRLALLDDPRERVFCQIEAAAHVLAFAPAGAEEALGYLAQARQQSLGLSAWINGLSLLAAGSNAAAATPRTGSAGAPRGASAVLPAAKEVAGAAPAISGSSAAWADDVPLLPAGHFEALRAALGEPARTSGAGEGQAR